MSMGVCIDSELKETSKLLLWFARDWRTRMRRAIARVAETGKLVVLAAGNDGNKLNFCDGSVVRGIWTRNDDERFLADRSDQNPEVRGSEYYEEIFDRSVLTVGSNDSRRMLSVFSRHGDVVDILAPGDKLRIEEQPECPPERDCTSGTSYSAPIVSGAAALIWRKHPGLTVSGGVGRYPAARHSERSGCLNALRVLRQVG